MDWNKQTESEILYNQISDLFRKSKHIAEIHTIFAATCLNDISNNPKKFRSLIAEMRAALKD